MNDELIHDANEDEKLDVISSVEAMDEEDGSDYEEISSDEVDRIVAMIEALAGDVDSENIRVILEEASDRIYNLVYSNEDEAPEDFVEDAA